MNTTVYAPVDFDIAACSDDHESEIGEYTSKLCDYIRVYSDVLAIVKPKLVFEWGPGVNTRLALNCGAWVWSVEQETKWLHEHHNRLVQHYLSVDHPFYPTLLGSRQCDVHFVDSRRRNECIEYIWKNCLQGSHVTVVHDAQRKRYWSALGLYKYIMVPEGTTAVATNCPKRRDQFLAMWNDFVGEGYRI